VIENPHEISKGHAIRFVAGTEADAPSVQIADASANDTISIRSVSAKSASNEGVIVQPVYREEAEREISKEELESGNVVELDELVAAPEIPPPSRPLGPLRDLPPSFKEKVNDDENKAYNKAGVSFSGSAVSDALRRPAKVVVNSLILDRQPSNLGKVDEIELGEVFAGIGQIVYLRANSRMAPGDRFQIWTSRGKLGKGYVFDICGVVQVTGYVDLDQNIFRAVVVSTNAPIAKGGLIIADKPKIVDFSLSTQRSEVSAEVIGGEFANKRELFGEGAIVFLNGGSLDGFKEGDLVGVQAVRKSRREKSNYPKSQYPVAIVKVVDVHERVATGLVVKASEAIATGDRTGSELPRDALKLHVENPEDLSHDVFGSSR
jgi:hypothetical protein